MDEGHFRPPGARKLPNRLTSNFACLIKCTVRPYTQNMLAAANSVRDDRIGEIVRSRGFPYFLVHSTRPHLTPRSVYFRWVHLKCFSLSAVFLCDPLDQGVKSSLFKLQNNLSMSRIRLSLGMGENTKHPLWLMTAPYRICVLNRKYGYRKRKMILHFTYHLCMTSCRRCAMQILSINADILGPP